MKVGEMLNELKKEEAELKRLFAIRKETFWVEGKKQVPIEIRELNERIQKKFEVIRKRKLEIQENNLKTNIGTMNLTEAILKIADLRNEITQLNELKSGGDVFSRYREEKENKVAQLNPLQIEELIAQLETEKTMLDSQIQSINWKEKIQV